MNEKKTKKGLKYEKIILNTIRINEEISVIHLSKKLGLWDSNLRKMIKRLNEEGKVEKFVKNKYIHVRIKNRD
jgi:Mn-dependent DtxR family transcriptional regulator